jgi:hypothetical protein
MAKRRLADEYDAAWLKRKSPDRGLLVGALLRKRATLNLLRDWTVGALCL